MKKAGKAKRRKERAIAVARAERQREQLTRRAAKKSRRVSEPSANSEPVTGIRVIPIDALFADPNEPITDRERRLAGMVAEYPTKGPYRKPPAPPVGKEES